MSMDIKELKELRIQLGLTQRTVAAHLGYKSDTPIFEWENGRRNPSPTMLQAYELFIQDVIDGKLNPPRSDKAGIIGACCSKTPNPVSRERMAQLKAVRQKLCLTLSIVARHVPFADSTIGLKEKCYHPTDEKDYTLFMAYYKEVKLKRIFGANYREEAWL